MAIAPPPSPDRAEADATVKWIVDHADRAFTWRYDRERDQLVRLYEKAVASQWSSVTDLDWSTDVDAEAVALRAAERSVVVKVTRKAAELPGSPFASWGEREFTQLAIEALEAQLSQFMHDEQGAMIVAAKIVETVPWIDAKHYAATQTMDEARHTEVFARYLHDKLGSAYPMNPPLEAQITALVEDSRWDIAYLGMQIVIESLALAAFGSLLRTADEPLLRKLLRFVLADEARHVAFGVLSLQEYYEHLSSAELRDRQDFLAENTARNRARSATPEVWERMGLSWEQAHPWLTEAVRSTDTSVFTSFNDAFFSKLVPNVRKLGLLDANDGYLRRIWAGQGLLQWEFADDTASDYESYDAVAADRNPRPRRLDAG